MGGIFIVTIYDVAKLANVSPKTVSRVLNNDAPVGKETRKKVEAAIAELGYVRSNAARMMRSTHSGIIGLITDAITFGEDHDQVTGLSNMLILQGIQSIITNGSKKLMIADIGAGNDKTDDLIKTFLEYRVEGLIYVTHTHKNIAPLNVPATTPLVLANCVDEQNTQAFVPDDKKGQYELVKKLIQFGHRRIGYITLPTSKIATQLRLQGYRQAHDEAGLNIDEALIASKHAETFKYDTAQLWHAVEKLLNLPNPPTVLCCGNDRLAADVFKLLRSASYNVPDDISVAGYDNHRTVAETLDPPLSTVELAYNEIGIRSANHLLSMIKGETSQQVNPVRIPGPLAWRKSVSTLQTIST